MMSLDESYEYAVKVTRERAKNFYYTFWLLPHERRRSICAVYAFSRRADDAVDAVEEKLRRPEHARAELKLLQSFLGDSPPDDPLVPSLRHTMDRFSISREPFDELVAGMEMDLVQKRYRTFDDLYSYCYRAAAVVGLICIRIFGCVDDCDPTDFAVKLGVGMQLTNILRDIHEDQGRGRIYLPQEDLERFEYSEHDLQQGIVDARFRSLMTFQIERARRYFRESEPLFPMIVPESRYCPILLMRFYSRILKRIERQSYDVFSRRPRLPAHTKLMLVASTWLNRWRQGRR